MKKCKGVGKAKNFKGCGIELSYTETNGIKSYRSKYGLGIDCKCFYKFLYSTEAGNEIISKTAIKASIEVKANKKKEDKKALLSLDTSKAMRLADMYFSRFMRLTHSDGQTCKCYTCPKELPIKEVDNGHFEKREHKATRYHEDNCRPQCKTCNGDIKHNGKQKEFRANLVNDIGIDRVEEVERLAKTRIKADGMFYSDIADKYRVKLKNLQKRMKVKLW